MKKIGFLMLLSTLTVFVACNKDNDDDSVPNEIVIDGEAGAVVAAYYDEIGEQCLNGPIRTEGCNVTHTSTLFHFVDAEYTSSEQCWPESHSIFLEAELYTPGTDGFAPGTFDIINNFAVDNTGKAVGWVYVEWGINYSQDITGTVTVTGSSFEKGEFVFDLSILTYSTQQVRNEEIIEPITLTAYFKGAVLEQPGLCD